MTLLDVVLTFDLSTSDARVEFTPYGGQASWWLSAMAKPSRTGNMPYKRPSDH